MAGGLSIPTWHQHLPDPPDTLFAEQVAAILALKKISANAPDFFKTALCAPPLKAFFIWLLNQDFEPALNVYQKELGHKLPTKFNENMTTQAFRNELAKSGDNRPQGEHPLKEKEYKDARKRLYNDPHMMRAMLAIEMGTQVYFSQLSRAVKSTLLVVDTNHGTRDIDVAMGPVMGGINAKGLTVELLPILALPNHDLKEAPDALTISHNFRRALIDRHAFESMPDGQLSTLRICPFKQTMAALMTMDIVKNADGTVSLGDQPKPGGLFFFIYRSLKEKGPDQTPAHKPA